MCGVEIDFVLVGVPKFTCFGAGVKINLVCVCGLKIAWFKCQNNIELVLCDGRN